MHRKNTPSAPADSPSTVSSHAGTFLPTVPHLGESGDLERRRNSLVAQRQAEMEGVFKRHDGYVRELFHLTKWVSLVRYDPMTAKQDTSNVFREFKAFHGFDLLSNTAGENTRITRRSRAAKLETMSNAPIPSKRKPTTNQKRGRKQKAKAQSSNGQSWDIIADSSTSVHSLPKKEASPLDGPPSEPAMDSSTKFSESISIQSSSVPEHGPIDSPLTELSSLTPCSPPRPPSELPHIEDTHPESIPQHSLIEPEYFKHSELLPEPPSVDPLPQDNQPEHTRSASPIIVVDEPDPTPKPRKHPRSPDPIPSAPWLPPISSKERQSKRRKLAKSSQQAGECPSVGVTRTVTPQRIPRIKLKPPRSSIPKPDSSSIIAQPSSTLGLRASLASAKADGEIKKYRRSIQNGWAQIDKFTSRFTPHPKTQAYIDFLSGGDDLIEDHEDLYWSTHQYKSSLTPQRTSRDIWDLVVDEAINRGRRNTGLAHRVGSRLAAEAVLYREELQRQEEIRLRALAKKTVDLVAEQWRKAVLLIKEYEGVSMGSRGSGAPHETLPSSVLESDDEHSSNDEFFTILETNGACTPPHSRDHAEMEMPTPLAHHRSHRPSKYNYEFVNDPHVRFRNLQDAVTSTVPDQRDVSFGLDELVSRPFLSGPDCEVPSTFIGYKANSSDSCQPTTNGVMDYGDEWRVQSPELSLEDLLLGPEQDPRPLLFRSPQPSPVSLFSDESMSTLFNGSQKDGRYPELNDHVSMTPVPHDAAIQRSSSTFGEVEENNKHASPATTYVPIIPEYLKPYSVTPVAWNSRDKIRIPTMFVGELRPYQFSGLQWLASLHMKKMNGVLADDSGLGKSVQTIAFLAHLACDRGIWGPHLIVAPTSTLNRWEDLFAVFCPGFRVVILNSIHQRKRLSKRWGDKHAFNVCITSYAWATEAVKMLKDMSWYYMILDNPHRMNFRSERWATLNSFKPFRRLVLSAAPLQDNPNYLCAILQFLSASSSLSRLKDLGEWPLGSCIEDTGNLSDTDAQKRTVEIQKFLAPYVLRRTTKDVATEMPKRTEKTLFCPLSGRQQVLYRKICDGPSTGPTQDADTMRTLRQICNHPSLADVGTTTPYALTQSAAADYEIQDLLLRRRFFHELEKDNDRNLSGLRFIEQEGTSWFFADSARRMRSPFQRAFIQELPGEPPPSLPEFDTIQPRYPIISVGMLNIISLLSKPSHSFHGRGLSNSHPLPDASSRPAQLVLTLSQCIQSMTYIIDHFAFISPRVIARDMPRLALGPYKNAVRSQSSGIDDFFRIAAKLYHPQPEQQLPIRDCGKLQCLVQLLQEHSNTGHRVLILTSTHQVLDILEQCLDDRYYTSLRLDESMQPYDRGNAVRRFNADSSIFCLIASSRAISRTTHITGVDIVICYDEDMEQRPAKRCEDLIQGITQNRDLRIYRLFSDKEIEWTARHQLTAEHGNDEEDLNATGDATGEELELDKTDLLDFDDPSKHEPEDQESTVVDYMLNFVLQHPEYFEGYGN